MPTDIHSQWRFELAQDISQELRKFTGIQAIMVGGSVARGYADEYSDLELPLFWDDVPSDRTRLDIAAALGANFLHPYN
jgi:predicted nucleotidyltransferase